MQIESFDRITQKSLNIKKLSEEELDKYVNEINYAIEDLETKIKLLRSKLAKTYEEKGLRKGFRYPREPFEYSGLVFVPEDDSYKAEYNDLKIVLYQRKKDDKYMYIIMFLKDKQWYYVEEDHYKKLHVKKDIYGETISALYVDTPEEAAKIAYSLKSRIR